MIIGCPKEIKNNENRVGLTPNSVHAYAEAGHRVLVTKGAGLGSAIEDAAYVSAGAEMLSENEEVWSKAEMIVKVKEPLENEYALMRENQIIYTYFHFAASELLTKACLERKISAVAYETISEGKSLPLLKPMSEVAGRMSIIMASYFSAKNQGGRGLLPMGVTGVAPAEVLVLGGGVVGTNAAKVAAGLGAKVVVMDINLNRLEYLGEIMPANVTPLFSDPVILEEHLRSADIIIGAVLVPGAVAPKLIRRPQLKLLKPGAVIVDVAIDQGGCFETSRPTTHTDPTYVVDDVIHYCVANMPGAYARTSTYALNNATIGYGLKLANQGLKQAVKSNAPLKSGLNMHNGFITFPGVAEAFGLEALYKDADSLF
ncbi:MAG: alanine dehydrogenase [Deltaproteobacteria bacterium]|jgi:alanine dehydrogenase|nr:alanine dehydrogenase [Deltaproteobacteria bacterium]